MLNTFATTKLTGLFCCLCCWYCFCCWCVVSRIAGVFDWLFSCEKGKRRRNCL